MAESIPYSRERKIRSPWGTWWLSLITFGIYYLVWYVKINREIASLSDGKVQVGGPGLWLSQCVPIIAWVSMAATSSRLSDVRTANGLVPTTTGGMTILSSLWFGSHIRYLQRRLNRTLEELNAVT